jgi:hypothetical protein
MMKGQARLSGRIMGFDTHMILEPCLLRIPGRRTGQTVINQPSRHYAEAVDATCGLPPESGSPLCQGPRLFPPC